MGAGAAATGIASLITESMVLEGIDIREAQERNILYDINVLITKSCSDITEFQKPFAHDIPNIATFVEAINILKPTGIIGVSTVPKLFNQQVIEAMTKINECPIIFPYSNPTSCSECTAEEASQWSNGKAIFASGSTFPPVYTLVVKFLFLDKEIISTYFLQWVWLFLLLKQKQLPRKCLLWQQKLLLHSLQKIT